MITCKTFVWTSSVYPFFLMLLASALRSPNSKNLLIACFRVEEGTISSKSKCFDDLGKDVMDWLELMMAIEAALDCDTPD